MSNAVRRLAKKKFVVYCEGDTEENYIAGLRAWLRSERPDVEVAVDRPINMHGGGFGEFLSRVKKGSFSNCIARFVLVDFDRCASNPREARVFRELVEYCRVQAYRKTPCFLIVTNPRFEYAACLHSPRYRGQGIDAFLLGEFGYPAVDDFKTDRQVWQRLNKGDCGHEVLCAASRSRRGVVSHEYRKRRSSFEVAMTRLDVDEGRFGAKGTNLGELYDVILW